MDYVEKDVLRYAGNVILMKNVLKMIFFIALSLMKKIFYIKQIVVIFLELMVLIIICIQKKVRKIN